MLIGISLIGLALLAVGGWMFWRKKSKKIITWLWFFAGLGMSGGLAASLTATFKEVGGSGAKMFSVGASAVLTIAGAIALLELWHGAHPKKGQTHTFHPVLALLTPILLGCGAFSGFVGLLSGLMGDLSTPIMMLFGG